MTSKSVITMVVAVGIGLGLGSYFGAHTAREFAESMGWVKAIAAQSQLARFSALQFTYADSAHAHEAVLGEIKTLQSLQRARPDFDAKGFLGIAYVRLAILEQKSGNKGAATEAFAQARKFYGPGRASSLVDSQLEENVRVLDRKLYHLQ